MTDLGFLSATFIGLAAFMTWFCHRRQEMLLALVAAILWLGLAVWFFLGPSPILPLGVLANDIIAWAFFILMFVPLMLQLNVQITNEAKGKSWTKYGTPPEEKGPPAYEAYRDTLYNRTRKRRVRR